ncbi:MAG TPA: NAD-binding protein [Thermodesulfobacteriota bacterium]|nr:NAD-binding protein [Thermodesulfobacteriota bacterium]
MKSHDYLIIGCGHFGSRAIETLLRKDHRVAIIVVDKDEKALEKVSSFHVERITGDGISFLNQSLKKRRDTYIIPAVPFHLAFEFALSQLKPLGGKRGKVPDITGLPNPMRGKEGGLYASFADFLCPEDCPEPPRHCTVTREKRGKSLYKILEDLHGPFESKVIRSKQLGLGVGGYLSEDLLETVREIKKAGASDRLILISTACRCHAVISALSF